VHPDGPGISDYIGKGKDAEYPREKDRFDVSLAGDKAPDFQVDESFLNIGKAVGADVAKNSDPAPNPILKFFAPEMLTVSFTSPEIL